MSTIHLVPEDPRAKYETLKWRNATGILATAYPAQWLEIQDALRTFELRATDIVAPDKSDLAKNFDAVLSRRRRS
jgi:hypothetical protein